MLLHLIESGRQPFWRSPPALWSTAAHGALVGSFVAAAHMDLTPTPSHDDETAERVVFMLPLLPRVAREKLAPIEWRGDLPGLGASTASPLGRLPNGGGRTTPAIVRPEPPAPFVAEEARDGAETTSFVYVESELDEPVERDPESAGPTYPEPLRQKGVEGGVTAEWVVDTTGLADVASFRVVSESHPLFGEAVRDVLPRMHFRAAVLHGIRVRQLVRQEFRFQIEMPAPPPSDSVKP